MDSLGKHIFVELYQCNADLINDVVYIEKCMEEAAHQADATIINTTFHHFSPHGVSGVIVIQESHLAIHTWPEFGFAALDIFTCGDTLNASAAYEYLKTTLQAKHTSTNEMQRGVMDTAQIRQYQSHITSFPQQREKIIRTRDIWFTERGQDIAISLRHAGEKLYKEKSPFQTIEVYQTHAYGKMLTLNGRIMCTENDEHAYHEMIAHVPMITHPAPRRVLIIGGGDGGAAREILKHDTLEELVLVEIDEKVIEASQKYFPSLASAFNHPKLTLKVENGISYVEQSPAASFDVVIIDIIGITQNLFTLTFFQEIHRTLKPEGIVVTQSESPYYQTDIFRQIFKNFQSIFDTDKVFVYLTNVPTYPTGLWSFTYATKGSRHPVYDLVEEKIIAFVDKNHLLYYNQGIHQSAFALPNFVQQMLTPETE